MFELDGASIVDFSNKDSEDSRILHAFSMSFARHIALAVKKHPCQVDDSKWASLRMWAARWYCRIAIKLSAHFNTSSSCPWLKLAAWLHQYTAVSGSWKLMIQSTIALYILWKLRNFTATILSKKIPSNQLFTTATEVFSKLIWWKKCVAVTEFLAFQDKCKKFLWQNFVLPIHSANISLLNFELYKEMCQLNPS